MDPLISALGNLGITGIFIGYLLFKSRKDEENSQAKDKTILELQEKRIASLKDVVLVVQASLKESANGSETIVRALDALKTVIESLKQTFDAKVLEELSEKLDDLAFAVRKLDHVAKVVERLETRG